MKLDDIKINQRVMVISQGYGDFFGDIMEVAGIASEDKKINITLKDNSGTSYDGFEPEDLQEYKNS